MVDQNITESNPKIPFHIYVGNRASITGELEITKDEDNEILVARIEDDPESDVLLEFVKRGILTHASISFKIEPAREKK